MNGAVYVQIWGKNFLASARALRMKRGRRKHKQTQAGNEGGKMLFTKTVSVLEWPNRSSDLNPVENLGRRLKVPLTTPKCHIS